MKGRAGWVALVVLVVLGVFLFGAVGGASGQEGASSVSGAAESGDTDGARRPQTPPPGDARTDGARTPPSATAPPGPGGAAVPEGMSDIHDIRPPAPPGPNPWRWALWGVGAALVAGALGAVLAVMARRRRTLRGASAPAMPPEERALAALRGLENPGAMEDRAFYFRLTAVLRRYLEERYGFPAAEMTTEELLPRLRAVDHLPEALFPELESLLAGADAVKFAGAPAAETRMTADLDFVHRLVRETRPAVPEAEGAG